ncbi:MAG: cupin domain-containing protein [Bacteroidales bacterium]|jgi:transcriptional regulator with XRE-family HTH domain|nr:cupin domain-containing protein [Bacteroidales bacterium]
MKEQTKEIGYRLKQIRENLGLSIADMAAQMQINKYEYEDYESGQIDIPVSAILKIAQTFNLEVSFILTGENPHENSWTITRKGEGASIERHAQYKYKALAHNFVHKKATPFLVTIDANDQEVQFNSHAGQEFLYILEGHVKIYFNDTVFDLSEGDSVYFDSQISHAIKAENNERARIISVAV